MTYDDCEAFEAQQAEERAGRLYVRWVNVKRDVSRLPEGDLRRQLEWRLGTLLPHLAFLEDGDERVKTAPIYRKLGEIRRALRALEGTGDTNRTEGIVNATVKRRHWDSSVWQEFKSDEYETHIWPGGYPIVYVDPEDESEGLCAEHAKEAGATDSYTHYEGPPVECSCGKLIESAYGDPDA